MVVTRSLREEKLNMIGAEQSAHTTLGQKEEPLYPILSVEELFPYDQLDEVDNRLRQTLPDEYASQLGESDRVVHIVTPDVRRPAGKPSVLREMIRLSRVSNLFEIGENGAPIASLSTKENAKVAALRKFEVAHGRDALEIVRGVRSIYPKLSRATILELASSQGLEYEIPVEGVPFKQEERGRIILLNRQPDDPVGKKFSKRLNWGSPFYGSIDATPSFVSEIVAYAEDHDDSIFQEKYINKNGVESTVRDDFDLSVNWLVEKLDENAEGLLEFKNTAPWGGIDAQSWRDSAFAYVHADGSRANYDDGIASLEVQSRAYDALLDAADTYEKQGLIQISEQLRLRAEKLRQQIFTTFWIDDDQKGGYFALATDRDENGNLRTMNVRSSSMGHLLNSRLFENADADTLIKRDAIIRQLFTPELLHASGIRTLASDEVAFRPGGYHTGKVWGWDSMFIADGLERQGNVHLAWEIRKRVWQTVEKTGMFPEAVRGDVDDQIRTSESEIYVYNTEHKVLHLFEQPDQEIQGWTVSNILAAKRKYMSYLKNIDTIAMSDLDRSILTGINGNILEETGRSDLLLEKA